MRHNTPGLTLAGFAALLLVACGGGGGGGGSSSSGGSANTTPVANAGTNQTVTSGVTVTLNGTASTDADGSIASYAWTQTAGVPAVTLTGANTSQPTFVAPTLTTAATLTFSLTVTDNRGATSTAAAVSVTVNPPPNTAPTANAGTNQSVNSGAIVTLNGTGSLDPDGSIASYAWTQTAGTPAVVLANGTTSQPSFTAPVVVAATTFTFSLVVTDNLGATSAASTVNVIVNPLVGGNVNVTGRVTFGRVLISAGGQRGLDYANPVQQAARGVIVRAINTATQLAIATSTTNDVGDYSLTVAGNLNITIQVEARMLRDAGQPLPRWDVSVRDGVASAPYAYTEPGSFSSSAGTAHNVAIPTGISAAGTATGARASGPFAMLDTVYQAIQTIRGVAPATDFPALVLDWGAQADGTFFSSGPTQRIALLGSLAADTDEFDQHVIGHEYGHYIEFNFSRADNIGGSHTIGEKLDPRVAFGEGFASAFAAIVLNSTDFRDSFTDNGTPRSTGFNIETNPPTTPTGACWCSESSVWSIVWDVYDSNADTNDNLAIGFGPIWSVLIGPQRTTPAFTTIFSFVTALKAARPGEAAAINTMVAAQNINATTIDAFATTETNVPSLVPANAALPIYTVATIGGAAVTLPTVDDAGSLGEVQYNKLGDRRYVRFNVPTARTITITASSSNPNNQDTDFLVFRAGSFIAAGTDPPAATETETFSAVAGDYLIDVYDCANGCDTVQGTPGDYVLTVEID